MKRAILLLTAMASFTMLGGDCNGDVVRDPTFRDWCGASLCAWTLDAGHIARVPTWNENDFGVSFTDTKTQISQVTPEGSSTRCLLFTGVADIDPAAQVSFGVDFNNDGTVDYSAPLPATEWHKVQLEISAPVAYDGITFQVRKDGVGTAILAEMRIQSTTGCTAPVVVPSSLEIGEPCTDDVQCTAGVCAKPGDVIHASIPLCSQCRADLSCASGVTCTATNVLMPAQCGPGQHLGAPGDPCVANADCKSDLCDGAHVDAVSAMADAGTCDLNAPMTTTNCFWDYVRAGRCH